MPSFVLAPAVHACSSTERLRERARPVAQPACSAAASLEAWCWVDDGGAEETGRKHGALMVERLLCSKHASTPHASLSASPSLCRCLCLCLCFLCQAFLNFIFLSRSFEKDRAKIQLQLKKLAHRARNYYSTGPRTRTLACGTAILQGCRAACGRENARLLGAGVVGGGGRCGACGWVWEQVS